MQTLVMPTTQVYVESHRVSLTRRDTSHTFHLIMSILTAGVWAVFV